MLRASSEQYCHSHDVAFYEYYYAYGLCAVGASRWEWHTRGARGRLRTWSYYVDF